MPSGLAPVGLAGDANAGAGEPARRHSTGDDGYAEAADGGYHLIADPRSFSIERKDGLATVLGVVAKHHGGKIGSLEVVTPTTPKRRRVPEESQTFVQAITPRFADYEHKIRNLSADPTASDVTGHDFLLAREGCLEVFYAPLHGITPGAQVVIIGLMPGRSQMVAAFREARRLLHERSRPPRLFRKSAAA